MLRNWRRPPTQSNQKLIAFSLLLMACALMLTGCASRLPAVVECPQAPEVPASLVSGKSQNVSDYLAKVQTYLRKAADFSETSTPTEKQSGN